jgi:CheY-like chemotaxis protein
MKICGLYSQSIMPFVVLKPQWRSGTWILNENVALVISDIEMPIMDESHSAKKFSNLETSHIPVILLTAKNSI